MIHRIGELTWAQSLRAVAVFAVVTAIFVRHLTPFWQVVGTQDLRVLDALHFVEGLVSYLLTFALISAILQLIGNTFRVPGLTLGYRGLGSSLAMVVTSLVPCAFFRPANERCAHLFAAAASMLAIRAAWEGARVPRTRSVALLLGTTGIAGMVHLVAQLVASEWGGEAVATWAPHGRGLATTAAVIDLLTLFGGIAFLAVQRRSEQGRIGAPPRTPILLAFLAAWGGGHPGLQADGWRAALNRALEPYVPFPLSYLPPTARLFAEALPPLLAMVALRAGRNPVILAIFALLMVARYASDAAIGALTLTLAALATPLAARDDRGLWSVLVRSSKPRGT